MINFEWSTTVTFVAATDGDPLRRTAPAMAERLVVPLGQRWLHVQAVADRVAALGGHLLPSAELQLTVAAGWLHDIGYAPELVVTGLHPLDGAEYLRGRPAVPEVVVQLVAYHTGALVEAEERGLARELRRFEVPPQDLLDVLTTADVVTGPDGAWVRAEDRVAEILRRYPPGHPVHRAVSRSAPDLLAAVERVEARLTAVGAPPAQPM